MHLGNFVPMVTAVNRHISRKEDWYGSGVGFKRIMLASSHGQNHVCTIQLWLKVKKVSPKKAINAFWWNMKNLDFREAFRWKAEKYNFFRADLYIWQHSYFLPKQILNHFSTHFCESAVAKKYPNASWRAFYTESG